MLEDNLGSVAGESDRLQDVIRHLGVGFNQGELRVGELARLGENARGDGDLAQIVQSAGHPQITQAVLGKAHLYADGTGYLAYPPLMTNGIGVPGRDRGLQYLHEGFHDFSFPTRVASRRPAGPQTQAPRTGEVIHRVRQPLTPTIRVSLIFYGVIPYFFGMETSR